ncbi:MAG: hypothetical protein JW820_09485 [Spirochaetales bacterium]|nr:hypothetical protein [Spirochaetales bacterium]
MKIKRFFLLINSLWELARLVLLFLAVGVTLRLTLLTDRSAIYWLVLLGSGQLLLPAALILLYLDPVRFAVLLNLVRLGKFLGLLAGLMLVFLSPLRTDLQLAVGLGLSSSLLSYTTVIGISIVDLIFLFLLFLWSVPPPDATASRAELPPDRTRA